MPNFTLTWSDFAALSALLLAVSGSNYLTTQAQLATVEAKLDGQIKLASQAAQSDRDGLREDFRTLSSEISETVSDGLEARTDEVVLALSRLSDTSESLTVKISNIPIPSKAFGDFEKLAMASGSKGNSYRFGKVGYGSILLTDLQNESAFEVQRIVDTIQAEHTGVQVSLELGNDSLLPSSKLSAKSSKLSAKLIEKQIEDLTLLLETIRSMERQP